MPDLHVWKNDCDWVIAESADDAWSVWCDSTGEVREDYNDCSFEQEPDEKLQTIWTDEDNIACGCRDAIDAWHRENAATLVKFERLPRSAQASLAGGLPKPPKTHPNGHLVGCKVGSETKTCREWADSNGRGFLASTEY